MRKTSLVWLLAGVIAALATGGFLAFPAAAGQGASVTITSPNYDSVHTLGESIVFACTVKSAGGGEIPKTKVVWTSQLDGPFGEGAMLKSSTLTVGIHRITVEVYDEAGASLGTSSIKLKVSQSKETDDGTNSGVAPIGVGKGEQYVVNPFN